MRDSALRPAVDAGRSVCSMIRASSSSSSEFCLARAVVGTPCDPTDVKEVKLLPLSVGLSTAIGEPIGDGVRGREAERDAVVEMVVRGGVDA